MDKFITLELNVAAILCDLIDTVLRRSLQRVFKSERIFKLSNQKKRKTTVRRFKANLLSAFSSGLKCVSRCLLRTGCPAELLDSESDDAWLGEGGRTTEMGRPKLAVKLPPPPLCFPEIRSSFWAPPLVAVTITMFSRYPRSLITPSPPPPIK